MFHHFPWGAWWTSRHNCSQVKQCCFMFWMNTFHDHLRIYICSALRFNDKLNCRWFAIGIIFYVRGITSILISIFTDKKHSLSCYHCITLERSHYTNDWHSKYIMTSKIQLGSTISWRSFPDTQRGNKKELLAQSSRVSIAHEDVVQLYMPTPRPVRSTKNESVCLHNTLKESSLNKLATCQLVTCCYWTFTMNQNSKSFF